MTIYATVTQTAGTTGYIFAKSNPAGTLRYLSLYSSNRASDSLWMYYVSRGVMRRVIFRQTISDGALHALELSVSNDVCGAFLAFVSVVFAHAMDLFITLFVYNFMSYCCHRLAFEQHRVAFRHVVFRLSGS